MPSFSKVSRQRLSTVDPKLQRILEKAIERFDFSVLCGHRTKEDQDKAFNDGFSKVAFPNSKHNSFPSMAVDIAPWPIDWNDRERFYYMAGVVVTVAAEMGIPIRWGGNWDMDFDLRNGGSFLDLPHFELV